MTDISQISKKLLAANRQVLIDAGLDPDSPYLPQSEASKAKVGVKAEKLLQRECEDWLHHRGYWRRTSTWIMADKKPPMGWQFHLHNARGNPQLLDILLLGNDGRYFECELKKERVHDHFGGQFHPVLGHEREPST